MLLAGTVASAILAHKAYDAQARVIDPLLDAGKIVVIPPKRHRKHVREWDRDLYRARAIGCVFNTKTLHQNPFDKKGSTAMCQMGIFM